MNKILYIAIISVVTVIINGETNYCNIASCGKTHTMCKFKVRIFLIEKKSKYNISMLLIFQFVKPAIMSCGTYERYSLNSTEKKALLRAHNNMRRRVATGKEHRGKPGPQPAASNLKSLVQNFFYFLF